MGLNPNTIKALFGKLKPAAKAVAPYADDVAKGVANYGDDVLRVAPKTERLPFKPSTTQLAERAKSNITKRQMSRRVPSTKDTKAGDALSELFDTFTSNASLKGVPEDLLDTPYTDKFGNAVLVDSDFPELWSYRKNPQMQIIEDSVKRRHLDPPNWAMHLDPETGREFPVRIDHSFDAPAPPSVADVMFFEKMSAPIPASVYTDADVPSTFITDEYGSRNVRGFEPDVPLHKEAYQTYDPRFEDSPYFPDGFASPDDFARYYDSLELGYTPIEWNYDSLNEAFSDTVDTNDWNDFWRAYYGDGDYADEGPLEAFFREHRKLPRGFTKQPPNRRIEEFFSNAMFQDDSWIK